MDTGLASAIAADLEAQPKVYFLYLDGTVKIGTAVDVEARVRNIKHPASKTASPHATHRLGFAKLVGSIAGGRRAEAFLHRKYGAYRTAGEWFYLATDLAAEIDDLTSGGLRAIRDRVTREPSLAIADAARGRGRTAVEVISTWPTIPRDLCEDIAFLMDASELDVLAAMYANNPDAHAAAAADRFLAPAMEATRRRRAS